jgi:hypothetical protein
MKELKSKKTGKITMCTDEEYAGIVNKKPDWLKRFEVTDMQGLRQVIPSITPKEIKFTKIKKNEG